MVIIYLLSAKKNLAQFLKYIFSKLNNNCMKNLSMIFMAAIVFASCKSKDTSLQTDKNIVILTDTSKAAGSYLSDTGLAKKPVAVAPVYVAPAPTKRTTTTKRRSSTTYGNSSAGNNNTNSTNNGSGNDNNSGSGTTNTTQSTRKKGWSKTAKGAVIGGVGGAVAGAVIGKGKGAIIGGVIGAAGGAIIGRSKDRKDGRIP